MNDMMKTVLPKTSFCKSMLVVDLAKDKSYKSWEAKEVLMTLTVIQGIVNRTEREKIYFINYPNEHFWNPCPADLQQLETDGFFDVPYTYAALNHNKKYPALSFLVHKYRTYIKGKIICPSLSKEVCDGAIMAAITACGQTDAIPVTVAVEEYLSQEGFEFDKIEDTRTLTDNIQALEWALKNYFNSETTKAFIGHHTYTAFGGDVNDQFPNLYDYYIANKAFVFCLDGNKAHEKEKLKDILNEKKYPLGVPIIGLPVDEGKGLKTIEDLGYYLIIANVQNLSCTSGITVQTEEFQTQPEPKAYDVDDNDVFVAFYVTDGDSMGFATLFHYDEAKNRIKRNDLPMGWSVNPLLFDIYPSLMKWKWNLNPNCYEMILDWNDQTWDGCFRKSNEEVFKKYCAQNKYYTEKYGIYTTNYFEGSNEYIKFVCPFLQINGYMGERGSMTTIEQEQDTIKMTLSGTSGSKDAAAIEFDIKSSVEHCEKGKPAFVLVCVGDGRADYGGGDYGRKLSDVMEDLKNASDGRTYKFVMPKDLAATWKKWKNKFCEI